MNTYIYIKNERCDYSSIRQKNSNVHKDAHRVLCTRASFR